MKRFLLTWTETKTCNGTVTQQQLDNYLLEHEIEEFTYHSDLEQAIIDIVVDSKTVQEVDYEYHSDGIEEVSE